MAVQYRLLGPLAVTVDGRPVAVGSGRLRSLLAALLLRAGDIVSVDELVDPLWSDRPPENPRKSLHTLVARLRKVLGPAATDLQTHPQGYRLLVPQGALDLDRFGECVAEGRRARQDGDLAEAAEQFAAAAALWSGPPLADVPSGWLLQHEVPRLDELRLAASEQRYAVEVQLGRPDPLIAQLRAEIAENPLRERFWAQLMRALATAQRQSEALEAYRSVAGMLRDELGVDPGPELQRLHQEILAGDVPAGSGDRHAAPSQLPPDIADFVGRDDVVEVGEDLLAPRTGAGAVPVVVLWGQAGVGKTTTAVHLAHRLRDRYPDVQLYVQLAGAGPTPREPAAVLAELLRDLGTDGRQVPEGLDRRAAALRTRLADRRLMRRAHDMLTTESDVRGATLAARDLAALTIDDDRWAAAVTLNGCAENFRLAGMTRFEAVAARLLAVAEERLGDPSSARAARARADALEPPGNANTDRLLAILVP